MTDDLKIEESLLLVIDVQGKLAHLMDNKELLFENLRKLIKGCLALSIPIILVEQNPKGLGSTIPEIADLLARSSKISKQSFSCYGEPTFVIAIEESQRKQLLISGIETHVCIYQTTRDLIKAGYQVQVVGDAVSSRTQTNRQFGLDRIREVGASITSVEMALFELLETAENPETKSIIQIVK